MLIISMFLRIPHIDKIIGERYVLNRSNIMSLIRIKKILQKGHNMRKMLRTRFLTGLSGAVAFMSIYLLVIPANAQTDPGLVIYPAPSGAPQNTNYTVHVRKENGTLQTLFCYGTEVGGGVGHPTQTSYAYFDADFSSRIEVKIIKNSGTVSSVKIRPLSYGIAFTRSGDTVSFFLNKPRKLSIEFNGDIYNNVHLFANPPEVNPPKQGDAGVIYYGPGITTAGAITLSSNQTLYIAGGAIVKGNITASNATNVKILGRGILQCATSSGTYMISPRNCTNVAVDGILIIGATYGQIMPQVCDHVTVNNIKILSEAIYSDGIDPVSCTNMTVNDVFIRDGDDCMSIKASGSSPNNNITVKNSIFWADGAHAVLIGPEGNGAITHNILYDSIDVLEVNCPAGSFWWGVVGFMCSGNVTMRDMTFRNFNIDNFTLSDLFTISINANQYNPTAGAAIRNTRYVNWSYAGPNTNGNPVNGYDATHTVDSVYFENLRINGQLITSAAQANCSINQWAYHIFFTAGPTTAVAPAAAKQNTATDCVKICRLQNNMISVSVLYTSAYELRIMRADGKVVRMITGNKPAIFNFSRNELKPGAYIVHIAGNRETVSKMMVL
jgi:hypothetical protein